MNGNNALEALETGRFKTFYHENNGREGLFINIQALSVWVFGNEAWALRIVSALLGTLTVLGVYFLTKEIFREKNFQFLNWKLSARGGSALGGEIGNSETVALLSTFFLATSYWHITFSRIGLRAIMLPLVSSFALYFLLRALRTGSQPHMILAGIFTGLGFYTYLAFRFMPFVLLLPIGWYLFQWHKNRSASPSCAPCLVAIFLFASLAVFTPLGLYFFDHPEDIIGRSGQVSIFTAQNPLFEFVKANTATAGMLFVFGDCNARHNYACLPELNPLVAAFFVIGLLVALRELRNTSQKPRQRMHMLVLLAWLLFMSLPATLTREGLPHALRSIGMIPPIMLLAGLGAHTSYLYVAKRAGEKKATVLLMLTLILIPPSAYYVYFSLWANSDATHRSFSTDVYRMGAHINGLSPETTKFVVTELAWPELRAVGTPAQTIMFLTDTFTEKNRHAKNIEYTANKETEERIGKALNQHKNFALFLLNNPPNEELTGRLLSRFPELHITMSGDFTRIEPTP
ncbi:MAG: hypothetical protein G01um101429_908 [Parcubacteria group bacterium Gr01-1014_29]|nr:MAG: hypothetical protein G01um101429_908 [Parcubacteria group bacterium Gr01-1014_29]